MHAQTQFSVWTINLYNERARVWFMREKQSVLDERNITYGAFKIAVYFINVVSTRAMTVYV